MITIKNFGLCILLLLQSYFANSCQCNSKEWTTEKLNSIGAIFIGTVVDEYYDVKLNCAIIKFSIQTEYKGGTQNQFIEARGLDNNYCKLVTEKGKSYLFFIYEIYNTLYAFECSKIQTVDEIGTFKIPEWLNNYLNTPDGFGKTFYKNGKLASEGIFNNHKPDGNWKYYDSLGNIKSFGKYKNGRLDSIWHCTSYSEYGMSQSCYKDGIPNGEFTNYFYEGKVQSIYNYTMGIKNGRFVGMYFNGNIASEGIYKNDTITSITGYYENGIKNYIKNDSLEVEWYNNGLMKKETKFLDKQIKFVKCWWENGKLQVIYNSSELWEDRILYGAIEVRVIFAAKENGDVMVDKGTGYFELWGEKGYYKDTLKVGRWKQEFSDGTIVENTYKKGIKHGICRSWTKENKLVSKFKYKNGKPDGFWQTWYTSGQIHKEGKYVNGEYLVLSLWNPEGKQMIRKGKGQYFYYDENGQSTQFSKTIEYINGKEKQ